MEEGEYNSKEQLQKVLSESIAGKICGSISRKGDRKERCYYQDSSRLQGDMTVLE